MQRKGYRRACLIRVVAVVIVAVKLREPVHRQFVHLTVASHCPIVYAINVWFAKAVVPDGSLGTPILGSPNHLPVMLLECANAMIRLVVRIEDHAIDQAVVSSRVRQLVAIDVLFSSLVGFAAETRYALVALEVSLRDGAFPHLLVIAMSLKDVVSNKLGKVWQTLRMLPLLRHSRGHEEFELEVEIGQDQGIALLVVEFPRGKSFDQAGGDGRELRVAHASRS